MSKVYATAEIPNCWSSSGWVRLELKSFRTVRRGVRCTRYRWEGNNGATGALAGIFSDYGHAIRYAEVAQDFQGRVRNVQVTEYAIAPY